MPEAFPGRRGRDSEADILDEAIAWILRLHSGTADTSTSDACLRWRRADHRHERVWQRLQATELDFQRIASPGAAAALRAAPRPGRRTVLKALGVGLAVGGAWAAHDSDAWQRLAADQATPVGRRRHIALGEGGELWLNTNSAVDLPRDGAPRVVLRAGEICVDCRQAAAPVQVDTPHGQFQAADARYVLRLLPDATCLWVARGVVDVSPRHAAAAHAGGPAQYRIDGRGMRTLAPPPYDPAAWADGVLHVQRMPLGNFVTELARYQTGWLRCDPAIAVLPVSGVYQLDDVPQVLDTLERALPVRIQRITRYWTRVIAI